MASSNSPYRRRNHQHSHQQQALLSRGGQRAPMKFDPSVLLTIETIVVGFATDEGAYTQRPHPPLQ